MSNFRDFKLSFWKTDLASSFYIMLLMAAASYVMFPLVRNEWTLQSHGAGTLFALGICVALPATIMWAWYGENKSSHVKLGALALSCLAFLLISIPAFFMILG